MPRQEAEAGGRGRRQRQEADAGGLTSEPSFYSTLRSDHSYGIDVDHPNI